MQAFDQLGSRGQAGRRRHLAGVALARYGILARRVVLLAYRKNTTSRVETGDGAPYLPRIHRTTGSPGQPPRSMTEVRSKLIWLRTRAGFAGPAGPNPAPPLHGAPVAVVAVEGGTEVTNLRALAVGRGPVCRRGTGAVPSRACVQIP